MRPAFMLMAAAVGLLLVPAMATAETPAPVEAPALDPAYGHLLDAMASGIDQEAVLNAQIDSVVASSIKLDPQFSRLVAADPKFTARMKQAMMPFVRRHVANVAPMQRQEVTALMARHLSPVEARGWATFYLSPLGRKVTAAAQKSASHTATSDAIVSNGEIDAKAVQSDFKRTMNATGRSLQGKLSLQEEREMLNLARRPSYPKFLAMMRELPEVRARIEMTPIDPALQAEMQVAIAEFMLAEREAKDAPAQ